MPPSRSQSPVLAPAPGAIHEEPLSNSSGVEEFDLPDLINLAEAHRAMIDELKRESPVSAQKVRVHQRTLRLILDEVRRRSGVPRPDPRHALQHAERQADLFSIEVPKSHRPGFQGAATRGAKRVALEILRPFHTELLRPQRLFNAELIKVLNRLVDEGGGDALAHHANERLAPLADPRRWRIQSHRRGAMAAATERLKHSYLKAIAPSLEVVLKRLEHWNAAVINVLLFAMQWREGDLDGAHRALGEVKRWAGLPEKQTLPPAARSAYPLWCEVFRRHSRFQTDIFHALAAVFGLPRLFDEGRSDAYRAWLFEHEPATWAHAKAAQAAASWRPLVSIIVPTYETPEPLLRECIESVIGQYYENWELCIADDGSRSPHVRRVLDHYARADSRIRINYVAANGGISRASNAALEMARGEFVCFLDHDDRLTPHALAEVVLFLNAKPETDVVYSDEDRLDGRGRRVLPFFKPDWSPDLLRCCNYVCHLLTVRKSLADAVGRLRPEFDGAQDFDYILRISEQTQRIEHIPQILYHWRAAPNSSAQNLGNKPKATLAGVRALEEHLRRTGEAGRVEAPLPTHYAVRYHPPRAPSVSIIATSRNSDRLARLEAGLRNLTKSAELICAGSAAPSADGWRHAAAATSSETGAWNAGARVATGEVLVFIGEKLSGLPASTLDQLAAAATRRGIGAVGPKTLYPDGMISSAGRAHVDGRWFDLFEHTQDGWLWTPWGSPTWTRNVSSLGSSCFATSRHCFEAIGGFDEGSSPQAALAQYCQALIARSLRVVCSGEATAEVSSPSAGGEYPLAPRCTDPYLNPSVIFPLLGWQRGGWNDSRS